jgi:hypothetical protein
MTNSIIGTGFTISNDHHITDKEPKCKPKTTEARTYSTMFSVTTTTKRFTTATLASTTSHCETMKGCSVTGSNLTITLTNAQIGTTQTIAPVGTGVDEACFTDDSEAYGSLIFAELHTALEPIGMNPPSQSRLMIQRKQSEARPRRQLRLRVSPRRLFREAPSIASRIPTFLIRMISRRFPAFCDSKWPR